jgi:type IV secretion system protein VirB10
MTESIEDRGDFDLRQKSGVSNKARRVFVFLGVGLPILFLLIFGIVWLAWSEINKGSEDIDTTNVVADAALAPKATKDEGMEKYQQQIAEKLAKLEADNEKRKQEDRRREGEGQERSQGQAGGGVDPAMAARQRRLGGGVIAVMSDQGAGGGSDSGSYSSNSNSESSSADEEKIRALANSDPRELAKQYTDTGTSPGGGGFESQLAGTEFAPARAYAVPPKKYLLKHNTYARCVLYTEIVTDYPGLIDCRLTNPLYSADGSVVLAEAGDILTGEQRVEIKPGQSRVFTSWTELETSSGVRARLNSLGAGPLGASGTDAWIDNHYSQRFGGAVMLSFIQDALQSVANATANNNSTYSFDNSSSNADDMASKALENTINIPPTGHIPAGTVLTVIVARDIDFSGVFTTREGLLR